MKKVLFLALSLIFIGGCSIQNDPCVILEGKVKSVFYDSGIGKHYFTGKVIDQNGNSHTYTSDDAVMIGDTLESRSYSCGGAINQPF